MNQIKIYVDMINGLFNFITETTIIFNIPFLYVNACLR